MITFDSIRVAYGDHVAVPGLDLTIEEGEFFTLLGPSGCGKTTALRTLAGFVEPQSGSIRINGRDVTRAPSHRRGVGMVFQNYALFPSMSVRENIAFGLRTARARRAEIGSRVEEIAEQVSLTPQQLDRGVAELSGGQQQRVAIARALIMRPEILLLDEPLSNLDAKLRQQLRAQLKDLQGRFGITTLYVTHDQEEALSMSDRLAVLDGGRIAQVGTPQELYDHSASEFVCTFLGDAHRLAAPHVDALRAQGVPLDPQDRHYVRPEKIQILEKIRILEKTTVLRHDAPGGSLPRIPGIIGARSFRGSSSAYAVDTDGGMLQVVVPENGVGRAFGHGDRVELGIDARWIRSYGAPAGQGAA